MPSPTPELRALLAQEAERVVRDLDASCASVSCWDRDEGVLRTVVNAGELTPADEPFPGDEVYPLDTFPAIDALLRFGRPYLDPQDVASTAVLAHMRLGSQMAVPVVVDGRVWGELWIAVELGARTLTADDLLALSHAAEALGRRLAGHPDA
jgi:GAF domain-containing protein